MTKWPQGSLSLSNRKTEEEKCPRLSQMLWPGAMSRCKKTTTGSCASAGALMNGGHECEQERSLSSHWWIQEPICQRPSETPRPGMVMCSDNADKLVPPLIRGDALRFIIRQMLGPISSLHRCKCWGTQFTTVTMMANSWSRSRSPWPPRLPITTSK